MDAVFLNFHKEEDFSSYLLEPCEDSQSYDGIQNTNSNYHWLDYERELNGDMGLIPIPSETSFTLSTSPPIKEDFNKIMSDWNQLVGLDVGDELVEDMANASTVATSMQIAAELPPAVEEEPVQSSTETLEDPLDIAAEDFDITKFVVGSEPDMPEKMLPPPPGFHTPRTLARRIKQEVTDYEDEDIDIEYHGVQACNVKIEKQEESSPETAHANHKPPKSPKTRMKTRQQLMVPPQRFGGKRIDMARGRYMVDEESEESDDDDEDIAIDVETVEGEVSHPVLQAGDLDSLLEQFEATETTNMVLQAHTVGTPERVVKTDKLDSEIDHDISLDITVEQVQLISPIKSPMCPKPAKTKRKMLDFREAKDPKQSKPEGITLAGSPPIKIKTEKVIKQEPQCKSPGKEQQHKNKQILDALPTELIDRIRATSKRKPVPVIEPITPIKRRLLNNNHPKDPITNSTLANRIINANTMTATSCGTKTTTVTTSVAKETVSAMLDHDYCSFSPKEGSIASSAKDSGFSSAEEDDKAIIRTQPTVKDSNGKLMVSLLKTNTIKKKLNLEEYKKRLQNRESDVGAPIAEDDENARRLKHTQMLMKMAQDHIKQGSSSPRDGVTLPPIPILQNGETDKTETVEKSEIAMEVVKVKTEPDEELVDVKPQKVFVKKTLVSVGTNTEESWVHLEQLLRNTHIKISPNSLISSIVEQLPKPLSNVETIEHGEDKTIVFIDTTRPQRATRNATIQTLHSSSHLLRQRRRRSSSSTSSRSSSSSSSSYSSDRSRSSSRSRSRSRSSVSRSPSPVRRKTTPQQLKEVEERRVVYVGKLGDDVTKEDLRRRFSRFGPITTTSVHFRQRSDNYGFVTFVHKEDAYNAVGRGNDNPDEPQYDLSFGGRRIFCQTSYSDLDNVHDDAEYDEYYPWLPPSTAALDAPGGDDANSFDNLLRKAQAKLRNRKL